MKLLFLGDLVGRTGRMAVIDQLPGIIADNDLDFVVVNGENAASGFGITEQILQDVLDAGADVVTLGNHSWDQRDTLVYIERQDRLLRPVNYPKGTPGRGSHLFTARNGAQVMVANVMGRVYMDAMDDPFATIERVVDDCPLGQVADAIIIDMHAEATSEKQAMGHFLDGRVSLVVGTHTHVPTADHQILTGGTAYMSDAGMCGDYDSVLGMEKEEPVNRFLRKIPGARYAPAKGESTISGVAIETDDRTGLALRVAPVRIGGKLDPILPPFWG
ncbi:TIGR00282 family metallophosphoesterase [Roseibium limicola]|uniref:TIGR00282 family metallophosphoesterase n=1 Tax=Roseibium limicola TaxID=2816037 RepID=A0A939ERT4_9HYPH|nr:TIGR00282 family metallophosphoesterase [Roseibium limicola]MBO0346922.1 TIGR00282 family metallophosphoesterase [Roseibium limicola]